MMVMPAYVPMLEGTYYARNYASIIHQCLMALLLSCFACLSLVTLYAHTWCVSKIVIRKYCAHGSKEAGSWYLIAHSVLNSRTNDDATIQSYQPIVNVALVAKLVQ